jgi:hypothetical protein
MSWGNGACIVLWHHGLITWLLHALTAWDLKFQVCLRYTFTPATSGWKSLIIVSPLTLCLCLCLSPIIPCWATLEDTACVMCTRRATLTTWPSLKLKTRPKQLLGYLPLDIAHPVWGVRIGPWTNWWIFQH